MKNPKLSPGGHVYPPGRPTRWSGIKYYDLGNGRQVSAAQLAGQVGISMAAARKRLTEWPRERWFEAPHPKGTVTKRVGPREIREMRELREAGMSQREIAVEMGLSRGVVQGYLSGNRGKQWEDE